MTPYPVTDEKSTSTKHLFINNKQRQNLTDTPPPTTTHVHQFFPFLKAELRGGGLALGHFQNIWGT